MDTAVSLGVGSVGGAVVSELLKVVIVEAKKVLAFKSVYKELASTMEEVLPVITEIEMLQSAEALKNFSDTINEALVLVRKCSEIKRWNLLARAKYTRKIEEINKKILKFCQIQLQLIIYRNQQLIMYQNGFRFVSSEPCDMLEKPFPEHTMEAIKSRLRIINKKLEVLNVTPPVYRDLCSVPKLDKYLVGLDLPLMELKKKLIDDSVVSLVVSGPPGCGKTTFVTRLCHDDEIKEKFEQIFFCVVSSAPNFRTIVQNLLQHNGYEALAFENDSQAAVGLRNLLEELKEECPVLLVLDDVWHGAESLLQKFQINIPNFKILVTSRFDFPSFGPTYHLKPLGDEDARSLLMDCESGFNHRFLYNHEDYPQKWGLQILKRCYGFPLLIEVLGLSLIRQAETLWELGQVESWSEEETILDNSFPSMLECMQPSFNALESNLKECFLDMGLFFEDQIRASVIIDIWVELYGEGTKSSTMYVEYLNDLASHNLLEVVTSGISENIFSNIMYFPSKGPIYPSKNEHEVGFYNEFLVTQHSILRELAICQSKSEEYQERKRLNLDIRDDKFPDWCLDLTQPINACLLSISTDDLFSSSWVEMDCPNVEALVLNISSSNYALPNFIATMKKLKVAYIFWKFGRSERLIQYHKLEVMRLRYCLNLSELPDTMERLGDLRFLDISNCLGLRKFPLEIGELQKLKKISMRKCSGCDFPDSVKNLEGLEVECCQEIGLLWKRLKPKMKKLSVIVVSERTFM